jgi:hypothetical protein
VVKFSVRRIGCGVVASFKVHAHAGVNRLRFKGRIHGRKLGPGVYRLRGRAGAKTVLRKTLVVGDGIVFTCSGANPLRTIVTFFSGGSGGSGSFGSTSLAGGTGKSGHESGSAVSKVTKTPKAPAPKRAGLLGARASKVLPGDGGTQLALLLILGAAIVLLALGALPREAVPNRAAAAFIAQRRALIAGGGLAALGAFLISYLIT